MGVPLADVSDLFLMLGKVTPAADTIPFRRATLLIDLASDWAREFAHKTWSVPGEVPLTVKGLVLAGAKREYTNPRRVTYEVKGPESASYDKAAYPPGFFTDAEIRYLSKYHGGTGQLWTQGTCNDDSPDGDGWLQIEGEGGWLPMFSPFDPGSEGAYHL